MRPVTFEKGAGVFFTVIAKVPNMQTTYWVGIGIFERHVELFAGIYIGRQTGIYQLAIGNRHVDVFAAGG